MEAKFTASRTEVLLIGKIIDRFEAITRRKVDDRMSLMMDLEACHSNGCSLDLISMHEAASDFDLVHDVGGIRQHLDRETGQLRDFFMPRYAARYNREAA
jgi:hypothetical protein